ncbi:MAG: hypothetical protein ACD_77C00032G0002 [uncultured bacterium]|nr:MAG: hypothetical protein ACD_77C00032G0002 [uncultured bacterium]
MDEVFLPPQGIDHIRQRLRKLEQIELVKIAARLRSIVDQGSAGYAILKEMKSEVEKEINELKEVLANAVVVDNKARV